MICSGKLTSRPTKHRDARPSPSQAGPQGAGRGKRRLPADEQTLVPPTSVARGHWEGQAAARTTTLVSYPRRVTRGAARRYWSRSAS